MGEVSTQIVFRRVARAEFDKAGDWYEDRRPGLSASFASAVQAVLDQIAEHPDRYAIAEGEIREAQVSGFPYCVYYRAEPERIIVLAVFHTSRDPDDWRSRT